MAGRGVAPSPPPSSSSSPLSVVCCMCGDYGLHRELFRCKVCFTRFQHKYCSHLYPKAEDYWACNWCLRDEGRKPSADPAVAVTVTSSSSTPPNKDINNPKSGIRGSGVKLHRGSFPSHLSNPVKKPKMLIQSQSDVGLSARQEELSPGIRRGRQAMRGKVRRYKLLEEVSS